MQTIKDRLVDSILYRFCQDNVPAAEAIADEAWNQVRSTIRPGRGPNLFNVATDLAIEWRRRREQAAEQLPKKSRDAYSLVLGEQLTHEQAAEELGISLRALRCRLRFAIRKLESVGSD